MKRLEKKEAAAFPHVFSKSDFSLALDVVLTVIVGCKKAPVKGDQARYADALVLNRL